MRESVTTAGSRAAQRRRLLRAPDLAAFRATLIHAALDGDAVAIRCRAVILPSRGAIELLRRTMEDERLAATGTALVLPQLFTREDWLASLAATLPGAPPLYDRMSREVLFERAAREAASDAPPPFAIRPGLIGAMLDFYDELRRRGRTLTRFSEVLGAELSGADADDDRGSHELLRQTEFLTRAFGIYESRIDGAADGMDEHQLRARVLASPDPWPIDHVLVAVADHPTDPRGLWPADFDLLGRLASVRQLDVFVTDDAHDAGFRERIDREIPELEDIRIAAERAWPTVIVPPSAGEHVSADYRDREEELRAVARLIRARAAAGDIAPLARTAVVFQRPLPYLYLAQQVLADAGLEYQAFDALPLSAEPWAALLDLALIVARTGGTRDSVLALLRSPLLTFRDGDTRVSMSDVARLDRLLIDGRVTDAPSHYPAKAAALLAAGRHPDPARDARVVAAARAAALISDALAPFRTAASASEQLATVSAVLRRFDRGTPPEDRERHLRARAAVLSTLDRLAAAYRAHDDAPRDPDALSAAVHVWIERQTFTPRRGTTGVHLVDAVAARFGAFDHVHLVGLVDAEWPERQRRSIFYTSSLLKDLGWPSEIDHLKSQQAGFRDLVTLPRRTLGLSAFQLEGDAVVAATPLTEEARMLPREVVPMPEARVFADERLALAPVVADQAPGPAAWLALRQARPELTTPAYRGDVGAQPPREYRVSSLDRFVECPFKYFAGAVLRLDEEVDEDPALTPRERGTLLHGIFEQFYRDWDAAGRGAVTMANVPDAIAAFEAIAHERLAALPEADRVIESARLLGSIVMRGAAERVFFLEAADARGVRRRWLEHAMNGTYDFPAGFAPPKPIAIRGVADRIDELDDGSLRLIDYKLSRPPGEGAVQLKVYGYAAQRLFEAADGQRHPVSAASYIAFGDDGAIETPVALKGGSVAEAIDAGAQQFAAHVTAIEAGTFPPKPENAGLCEWCAFALVCRKETVETEEDDAAAESV